jgi:acyl carrier protein
MQYEVVTVTSAVEAVNDVLLGLYPDAVPATADTELRELPLESIDFAEVFVMLEERAGVELDLSSLSEIRTVADLTRALPAPAAAAG